MFCGYSSYRRYLRFKAEKVGKDTMLSQIMQMVEAAQGSKAPIAKTADKIAAVFVPVVLVIALVAGLSWWFAGSGSKFAIQVFVAVLCYCMSLCFRTGDTGGNHGRCR